MTGCMVGWPRSDPAALQASVDVFANEDGTPLARLQTQGAASCFQAPLVPPPFLHYCQHYSGGAGQAFGKRGVPHTVLECSSPPVAQAKRKSRAAGSHDAATGVKHNAQSLGWNALAYCAVTRGVDHARDQFCLLAGR